MTLRIQSLLKELRVRIEKMIDKRASTKRLIVAGLVSLLIIFGIGYDLKTELQSILSSIRSFDSFGPFIFILIYVLANVALVPGLVLTMGSGVIFGVLLGTLLSLVSATLGATAAFLIGRYLARDWVEGRLGKNKRFKAIEKRVSSEGWKIVILIRFSPIFPFNLINYGFGLTSISLRDYVFASFVGMLPGTLMYVYIGSIANDWIMIGANDLWNTKGPFFFHLVGLIITVLTTIYITRISRSSLDKRIQ